MMPHKEEEYDVEENEYDDDYVRAREEMRHEMRQDNMKKRMEMEAELDDDFVKLQIKNDPREGGEPQRRRINDATDDTAPVGTPVNHNKIKEKQQQQQHGRRRRLQEELKLIAGEPYQKTIQAESPGWYRLCVNPKNPRTTIEVEMELRKSSTYGEIDPRTGHVPSLEEVETHEERLCPGSARSRQSRATPSRTCRAPSTR